MLVDYASSSEDELAEYDIESAWEQCLARGFEITLSEDDEENFRLTFMTHVIASRLLFHPSISEAHQRSKHAFSDFTVAQPKVIKKWLRDALEHVSYNLIKRPVEDALFRELLNETALRLTPESTDMSRALSKSAKRFQEFEDFNVTDVISREDTEIFLKNLSPEDLFREVDDPGISIFIKFLYRSLYLSGLKNKLHPVECAPKMHKGWEMNKVNIHDFLLKIRLLSCEQRRYIYTLTKNPDIDKISRSHQISFFEKNFFVEQHTVMQNKDGTLTATSKNIQARTYQEIMKDIDAYKAKGYTESFLTDFIFNLLQGDPFEINFIKEHFPEAMDEDDPKQYALIKLRSMGYLNLVSNIVHLLYLSEPTRSPNTLILSMMMLVLMKRRKGISWEQVLISAPSTLGMLRAPKRERESEEEHERPRTRSQTQEAKKVQEARDEKVRAKPLMRGGVHPSTKPSEKNSKKTVVSHERSFLLFFKDYLPKSYWYHGPAHTNSGILKDIARKTGIIVKAFLEEIRDDGEKESNGARRVEGQMKKEERMMTESLLETFPLFEGKYEPLEDSDEPLSEATSSDAPRGGGNHQAAVIKEIAKNIIKHAQEAWGDDVICKLTSLHPCVSDTGSSLTMLQHSTLVAFCARVDEENSPEIRALIRGIVTKPFIEEHLSKSKSRHTHI